MTGIDLSIHLELTSAARQQDQLESDGAVRLDRCKWELAPSFLIASTIQVCECQFRLSFGRALVTLKRRSIAD